MIKKIFVQTLEPVGCEARSTEWRDREEPFEYWLDKIRNCGYGPYGVREVEKIFDPETFKITENEIRKVKA